MYTIMDMLCVYSISILCIYILHLSVFSMDVYYIYVGMYSVCMYYIWCVYSVYAYEACIMCMYSMYV